MIFVKNSRGGREVIMINTLSKINLSKIGWEGGCSTSIWIMSLNILCFFLEYPLIHCMVFSTVCGHNVHIKMQWFHSGCCIDYNTVTPVISHCIQVTAVITSMQWLYACECSDYIYVSAGVTCRHLQWLHACNRSDYMHWFDYICVPAVIKWIQLQW